MRNALRSIIGMLFMFIGILPTVQAQPIDQPPGMPGNIVVFAPNLAPGWTLLGNPFNKQLSVAELFGSSVKPVENVTYAIVSVWKWIAGQSQWQFYSPQLTAEQNATYAASKGMNVLSTINPGEGFWVSSRHGINMPQIIGDENVYFYSNFVAAAPQGWNLIGGPRITTPRELNQQLGNSKAGVVPTDNIASMWAWDKYGKKWAFYAPSIDVIGDGNLSYNYANDRNMYDGTNWNLEPGDGLWVNRKSVPTPPVPTVGGKG